jgi:hypothetical protein
MDSGEFYVIKLTREWVMVDLGGTRHKQLGYLGIVVRELMGDSQISPQMSQSKCVV